MQANGFSTFSSFNSIFPDLVVTLCIFKLILGDSEIAIESNFSPFTKVSL